VNLDVSYVKSHTLAGDLGILFRTVGAVLQKTGK
jgi:lipopolysaccharide/colanic/teichoic acid biosynthesis glycosyltransferase